MHGKEEENAPAKIANKAFQSQYIHLDISAKEGSLDY
jgi:hypothetical protein